MNVFTQAKSSHYRTIKVYLTEARFEFIRLLRTPMFALPSLIFPPMFFFLFGVLISRGRSDVSAQMLASYCIFGVMGPGLFGFGVNVAIEREQGWLKWRRAVPALAGAYFCSKIIMAAIFALIIFIELSLIAYFFADVDLSLRQWSLLLLISVLTSLPFSAMGLVIGTLVSGQAAPAIVNFIYMPMAFLSGLLIPLSVLPKIIGNLAPIWPSYHAAQIALKVIQRDLGSPLWFHLGFLVVFTLLMLWLSQIFWSRMKLS